MGENNARSPLVNALRRCENAGKPFLQTWINYMQLLSRQVTSRRFDVIIMFLVGWILVDLGSVVYAMEWRVGLVICALAIASFLMSFLIAKRLWKRKPAD
jgi:hypothetical protein